MKMGELPYLYGVQYYRAPTPGPECWEKDLSRIREMGFNTVKYWVQWRWSERQEGVYCWDDLDTLMDLAQQNGLKVILNLILDVMPVWVPEQYPDALMVDCLGRTLPVIATGCRQIGGYPGPCYNHDHATAARQRFFAAAIQHFKGHPALFSWDVWNEPEHHLGMRSAEDPEHWLCYCGNCRRKFIAAMQEKYGTVEKLNAVWGRCYSAFSELELPKDRSTFTDFIDWREFQLDTLTHDAEWRLDFVHRLAPETPAHLHVVPDTAKCFHAVNCVDDFALARKCDFFGATTMADRAMICQSLSAAPGKMVYNAEWHVNFGMTGMPQRVLTREAFLKEALPQFGWGLRGILYWQYRSEVLGLESPCWGVVRPDGSGRPVTQFAEELIRTMGPYLREYTECRPGPPRAAILRDRKNELFQYCISGSFENVWKSLYAYSDALYRKSILYCFLPVSRLENAPEEIPELLIVPCAYYLSDRTGMALTEYVRQGGTLLIEGIPGGYSADRGRHSAALPGCGLAKEWGLEITETASSFHLDCREEAGQDSGATGDVAKALDSTGVRGGRFLPLHMGEDAGYGALCLVCFAGDGWTPLAYYRNTPCIAEKHLGKGRILYAGTLLGCGAEKAPGVLYALLDHLAGTGKPPFGLHESLLRDETGNIRFVVRENTLETPLAAPLPAGSWRDLFSGRLLSGVQTLPPLSAVLCRREPASR